MSPCPARGRRLLLPFSDCLGGQAECEFWGEAGCSGLQGLAPSTRDCQPNSEHLLDTHSVSRNEVSFELGWTFIPWESLGKVVEDSVHLKTVRAVSSFDKKQGSRLPGTCSLSWGYRLYRKANVCGSSLGPVLY